MTTIVLHGLIAKKFKQEHKFTNINKVVDALSAIDANYPGFKSYIQKSAMEGMNYEFIVDDNEVKNSKDVLSKKEIKKIEIVPSLAGKDPVTFFVVLAINLVIAGIQYLMTSIPEEEPKVAVAQVGSKSFFFANRDNLASQNTAVPIGYGTLRVGSKIIETIISSNDLNSSPEFKEDIIARPEESQLRKDVTQGDGTIVNATTLNAFRE
jgi:predicted phage tail protein|tara:strand:- start:6 stop:632 length:627 start_codon:yes stop_codon:yes gene_type:complete